MKREQPLHIPLSFDDTLRLILGEGQSHPETFIDIWQGDCREELKKLGECSVHMVLTDPPYFLDGLDTEWRKGQADSIRGTGSVGGLPVGMRFDPKQGKALQDFLEPVAKELMRVLVPGGFFVSFSQPRLFHRVAMAAENAGFEIRDMFAWHYTKRAQFKAFSMTHFIERMDIPKKEKNAILRELQGRKTPQLRPQFEALMLAEKPREGTFVENWLKHRAGLIDATKSLNGASPTTVMAVEKPIRKVYNSHLTVKPVRLLMHLIELFTCRGQIVLDPFLGSGSTALAAMQTGRSCIGIEINPDYIEIAERRIKEVTK
jgi:DNA modification methylase